MLACLFHPWKREKSPPLDVYKRQEVDTASGAIAKPINLSVTFERDTDGSCLLYTSRCV